MSLFIPWALKTNPLSTAVAALGADPYDYVVLRTGRLCRWHGDHILPWTLAAVTHWVTVSEDGNVVLTCTLLSSLIEMTFDRWYQVCCNQCGLR